MVPEAFSLELVLHVGVAIADCRDVSEGVARFGSFRLVGDLTDLVAGRCANDDLQLLDSKLQQASGRGKGGGGGGGCESDEDEL